MRQKLILLMLLLIIVGTSTGYVILGNKITEGRQKIADGQKQLEDGEQLLARGKARLASGKQRLSGPSSIWNGIKSLPLMGVADKLPVSSEIINMAGSPITDGNRLIAQGAAKIKNGESQLEAGKEQLAHGMHRLNQGNIIRIACGFSAMVTTFLFLGLGYRWRRQFKIGK